MNEDVEIDQSPVQTSSQLEKTADPSAIGMGQLVGLFSAGVAICFFLPWLKPWLEKPALSTAAGQLCPSMKNAKLLKVSVRESRLDGTRLT